MGGGGKCPSASPGFPMSLSWVGIIVLILAWLDKNYGFFTYDQIAGQFRFFASVSSCLISIQRPERGK